MYSHAHGSYVLYVCTAIFQIRRDNGALSMVRLREAEVTALVLRTEYTNSTCLCGMVCVHTYRDMGNEYVNVYT
jgi:hypothetical protein